MIGAVIFHNLSEKLRGKSEKGKVKSEKGRVKNPIIREEGRIPFFRWKVPS